MLSYFKQFVYVQLSPERLTVRDPKTRESISEPPEIAIFHNGKATVVGVGLEARKHAAEPGVEVLNPFTHPRSLLSDFTAAEQVLKNFLRRLRANQILLPNPVVVMHPLGEFEGGLTQIELRVLRELALGSGASRVIIWQGQQLTDEQLLSGTFPQGGKVHAA